MLLKFGNLIPDGQRGIVVVEVILQLTVSLVNVVSSDSIHLWKSGKIFRVTPWDVTCYLYKESEIYLSCDDPLFRHAGVGIELHANLYHLAAFRLIGKGIVMAVNLGQGLLGGVINL